MVALTSDQEFEVAFTTGLDSSGHLSARNFWSWNSDSPATYGASTYSAKWGPSTPGAGGGVVTFAFNPASNWTQGEQNAFVSCFSLWAAECNISFKLVTDYGAANIDISRASDGTASGGITRLYLSNIGSSSDGHATHAEIAIDTSTPGFGPVGASFADYGGYPWEVLLHEIGHSLGLGHAGAYNKTANAGSDQLGLYDSRAYSIMSYIDPKDITAPYYQGGFNWGLSGGDNGKYYSGSATTPMGIDILAIQRIYGLPLTTPLSGGQVFGFNCNIPDPIKAFFDFTVNTKPVVTLWDAGGNNTLDTSSCSVGEFIDLHSGSFSNCLGLSKNIFIAFGTQINTAIGGSGPNTIIANDNGDTLVGGAGDDVLFAGLGNDIIDGRAGIDTAIFGSSVRSSVILLTGSTVTVGGSDGTDTVTNVEILKFSDGVIYTGNIAAADVVYETYFARDATAFELAYWTARGDQATAVGELRQGIINTSAGQAHLPLTVQSFYETYLGREPVASEMNYWVNALSSGQVSFASAQSTFEGQAGAAAHEAAEVSSLYQAYFGRAATSGEINYWQGQLASGADTGEELRTVLLENPAGAAHTASTITYLYDTYFGRDPSTSEASYWSNQVLGGVTFEGVRTALVTTAYGAQHTDATVATLYQSYLGRAPSASEANYWQGAVQAGSSFDFLADALATQGSGPQIIKLAATPSADSFTFAANSTHLYIDGFDAAHDTIRLSGLASFDPLAHATDVVGPDGQHDVLITYDTNDTILLHHVTLTSLSAMDFIHI